MACRLQSVKRPVCTQTVFNNCTAWCRNDSLIVNNWDHVVDLKSSGGLILLYSNCGLQLMLASKDVLKNR